MNRRDTTERQQSEEERLEQLRCELFHAARLSLAGELTAALAHELRQPLAAISANAAAAIRMIDSSVDATAELREALEDIRSEDRRAHEVIARLVQLLRRPQLELRDLDMNVVVSDVARLMRAEASQRHIPMHIMLADELPHVRGDRVYLQQVLMHLIFNSMQSLSEVPAADRRIDIQTRHTAKNDVVVRIEDSGRGTQADVAARMFDPFFSTRADGLGLGLPIARSIVEAHGGRIEAEPYPTGGAAFSFSVPCVITR